MDKKKLINIVIIVVVLLSVVTVYFIKNREVEEIGDNKDFYMTITENLNIEKLKEYKLPILISFGSESCMPCMMMQPHLRQLNTELKGKAIIKYLDVWKHPEYIGGKTIEYVPTQIFITKSGKPYENKNVKDLKFEYQKDENGNILYTYHVGYLSYEDMKAIIEELNNG